ncbi:MAG: histidine phosphatase family protein [Anaerolineales bacterium]|jgi:broad specificity phosphatase PhoE
MKFYVVRHADKARGDFHNPQLRHNDQPISALGRRQAAKLKRYFGKRRVDAIYVSEYLRTGQTIRSLAKKRGIVPLVDPRLDEIDIGIVEYLSDEEIPLQYPEVWRALVDQDRDFRWPEGETGSEALARIAAFVDEKKMTDVGNILVVTHDGLIRLLVCHVLDLAVYQRFNLKVDTASVTEIDWDETDRRWKLIRFNQEIYPVGKNPLF